MPDTITAGPVRINTRTRQVRVHDRLVEQLTVKEFAVLFELAQDDGQTALSRRDLAVAVWGPHAEGMLTRTLDSHCCRLRRKLSAGMPAGEALVVNIWGYGFALLRPTREAVAV